VCCGLLWVADGVVCFAHLFSRVFRLLGLWESGGQTSNSMYRRGCPSIHCGDVHWYHSCSYEQCVRLLRTGETHVRAFHQGVCGQRLCALRCRSRLPPFPQGFEKGRRPGDPAYGSAVWYASDVCTKTGVEPQRTTICSALLCMDGGPICTTRCGAIRAQAGLDWAAPDELDWLRRRRSVECSPRLSSAPPCPAC